MSAAIDIRRLLDTAAIDREAIRRRGFREFVKRAWSLVDTSILIWSWHLDAICEHLEAVARREIRELVINIPPGLGKSLLVSVLWPAWVWTIDQTHRYISASYASEGVALRDSRKCRSLVENEWFQTRWPHIRIPRDKTASIAVSLFYTTVGGMRYTTTPKGQATGQHGDTHIVDDPIDPSGASAASGIELDEVRRWDSETMSTRFRNHNTKAKVLVMQRVHERDLSDAWIARGATVLCLPMRFEKNHPHRWPRDPRTQEGELLAPERFPEEVVKQLEAALGPYATAAQLQQRPAPAGGGIFKAEWFKYWIELPTTGTWSLSVDCAFKDAKDSSYVVLQVWLQSGPNFYLVDQRRERMAFPATVDAIKAMVVAWPKIGKKIIEDKANGPAVAATLASDIPGIELVNPEGGKIARAHAVTALVSSGNVYLPDAEKARYPDGRRGAEWVTREFLPEVTVFPNAANDDQVDTMTQALNKLGTSFAERFKAAMANARKT